MPTVSVGFNGFGSSGDCEKSKAENSTLREIQDIKPYFRFQNEEYPFNAQISQMKKRKKKKKKKKLVRS